MLFGRKHVMNELWFVLFSIVLCFGLIQEQCYIFIYYTFWSFTLEVLYFGLVTLGVGKDWLQHQLYSILLAPSIVVCLGFWMIIAPTYYWHSPTGNIVMAVTTHGCNMVALLSQTASHTKARDVWKPVLFTTVYQLFLVLYVGSGGRSISGKLPYWYAQYDVSIGWVFAGLAIVSVGLVHISISTYRYKPVATLHIV